MSSEGKNNSDIMDNITVPRRHSSCSIENGPSVPKSPIVVNVNEAPLGASRISPQIMERFFTISPKKRVCNMDCNACRQKAKKLRDEQLLLIAPVSAPCSRKSSASIGEILSNYMNQIFNKYYFNAMHNLLCKKFFMLCIILTCFFFAYD